IEEQFQTAKAETTLQHGGLEGAWWLEQATWTDGRLGEGRYAQAASLKLYVYPRFATAMFNKVTGEFLGATGGTYQYDGTTLTEVIDYATWGIPRGEKLSIRIQMAEAGHYKQQWENSIEVWKKLKQNSW
ncbi:MAG TPA: hypothetical protein VLL95_02685, partial [Phnomibacter sp.]|nr:hypothetical protein [Phnomibacter sp.]